MQQISNLSTDSNQTTETVSVKTALGFRIGYFSQLTPSRLIIFPHVWKLRTRRIHTQEIQAGHIL